MKRNQHNRNGFTLIEILVVVTIMAALMFMAVAAYNSITAGDHVRAASRQLQSAIMGARDRATHDREIRGLRLYKDETGRLSNRIVYVGEVEPHTAGTIQVGRMDANGDGLADDDRSIVIRGTGTGWKKLHARGLLVDETSIKIPNDATGAWYVVNTSLLVNQPQSDPREHLVLTTEYRNAATIPFPDLNANPPGEYELKLECAVLPNQQPIVFPKWAHVDFEVSDLSDKDAIGDPLPTPYDKEGYLDILFAPNGRVHGVMSARGFIHLVVRDQRDIDLNLGMADDEAHPAFSVTILALSGNVATFPIHLLDTNNNGIPDDPFLYAETGKVAGQ